MTVVVEVPDQRRRAPGVEETLLDFWDGRCGIRLVHSDSHQLGAGVDELEALRCRGGRVRSVGQRHRLHGNRRAAANSHVADAYLNRWICLLVLSIVGTDLCSHHTIRP